MAYFDLVVERLTSFGRSRETGSAGASERAQAPVDPARASGDWLVVSDLEVVFGSNRVLDGLSFSLRRGEIGCLLGASGCGKTTALRSIAGFVQPGRGRITIAGNEVTSGSWSLAPEQRGVGVVFQDYALFPHLDIASNVAFGLRAMPAAERADRVARMLELVGLASVAARFPHELSGGQQQRVALARALAPSPSLLLLDEPFSSLDPDLRERLALDLREILKQQGITALLVTHDQNEAFALADSIGVMDQGKISQWGSAYRLYHRPDNRKVADFVGLGAFVPGRLEHREGRSYLHIEIGVLPIAARADQVIASTQANDSGDVSVLLRPDDVIHDDDSPLQAEVVRKSFRGASFLYTLRLPSGTRLLALVPSHHDHAIGEWIGIRVDADHIVTFPIDEGPEPLA